jgi:hypothetical protein
MEKEKLKCLICGDEFTPRDKRQRTCAKEECKRIYQNTIRRLKRAGVDPQGWFRKEVMLIFTDEQLQKMSNRAKWKVMTLAQRNAFARSHGMTYGKMDARMRMEGSA